MAYKPVLPSSLMGKQNKDNVDFGQQVFGNNTLKMGVVIKILEPEDDNNKSKLGTEYHVMAIEQDKRNGINSAIYKNCLAMDSFGGIADFFQFKRREPLDAKKVQDSASTKEQEGSMVLLLCLDGNAEKAVIIGQMQNSSRKVSLNEEAGHHGEGEFNGIRYVVNKDGAFTLTFKGATDNDGKPKDAAIGGSQIKIEKDGSFEVNDAAMSGELKAGNRKPKEGEEAATEEEAAAGDGIVNEKFRMDRAKMTIDVESRKAMSLKTDDEINITSKKANNIKCMDLIVAAEGKAGLESGGPFKIKAGGPFEVAAPAVKIMSDDSVQVMGSSIMLSAPQVMVGDGGTPAIILSTQFMGTGNLGAPVISLAIGPFSGSVFIAP